jgi:hypothetical protein
VPRTSFARLVSMSTERERHREVLYWRQLLERVAGELERIAGREPDPARGRLLSARAMRIRKRLHEGMPADFDPSPMSKPPPRFEELDRDRGDGSARDE